MDSGSIESLGSDLYEAWLTRQVVEPLKGRYGSLSIDDSYAIQRVFVESRIRGGASLIGKKIGVTSRAVMRMLEVYQPDFGVLLSDMLFSDGQAIEVQQFIQPKIEGEIAFVLKQDLAGPGVGVAQVLAATECLVPCLEIVDSRIRDWRITIEDTIADNASCGALVLGGGAVDPLDVELAECGMVLERNGEIFGTGAGAAALGSPANSVAWLANTLGRFGSGLRAGEVVLSGALSGMAQVVKGDCFHVSIGGIGDCEARFS